MMHGISKYDVQMYSKPKDKIKKKNGNMAMDLGNEYFEHINNEEADDKFGASNLNSR